MIFFILFEQKMYDCIIFNQKLFDSWYSVLLKVQLLRISSQLQFENFGSDKSMIAFSSSSNVLSTDFVKSMIASNFFMKILWKEVKLCAVPFSVGLRDLLGVCGTSSDMSGVSWVSWVIADISSGDFCVSGMVKDVICVCFVFLVPSWLCSQLEC